RSMGPSRSVHSKPSSRLQVDEQPSPLARLPSSHSWPMAMSIGNNMPSPQAVVQGPPPGGQLGTAWHWGVQPSRRLEFLLSSHCSVPCRPVLLPQVVWPQVDLPLASSVQTQPKSSAGFCPSTTHAVQPSLLVGLPSSHCSEPRRMPSPHCLARQAMPGTGQSHPAPMVLQSEEQPSLVLLMGAVLPSSQTS